MENAAHEHAAADGIGYVVAVGAGPGAWIKGTGVAGDTGVAVVNTTQGENVAHEHPLTARNADSAANNEQPYGVANVFIKI